MPDLVCDLCRKTRVGTWNLCYGCHSLVCDVCDPFDDILPAGHYPEDHLLRLHIADGC